MSMSTIFRCIGCEQHYCANCDGGEDSCARCGTGPRCDECAVEHEEEHEEEEEEDEEEHEEEEEED